MSRLKNASLYERIYAHEDLRYSDSQQIKQTDNLERKHADIECIIIAARL